MAKTKSLSCVEPPGPAYQLYADHKHRIYELSDQVFLGQSLCFPMEVDPCEVIPLPEGSRLFSLPGLTPYIGTHGRFEAWQPPNTREPQNAAAAFLPPAYVRLLLPAAVPRDDRTLLPMWAYTAVGGLAEGFVVPALRIDPRDHWDVKYYDDKGLMQRVQAKISQFRENRLVRHLAHCATEYHCFAAKNFFWERWECPLPVAQACNSSCLFCLSEQKQKGFRASQQRITFLPSVKEIADIAIAHINKVTGAIVSFGQGCEGEPILYYKHLCQAIRSIRRHQSRGTINLNTNGSIPGAIPDLAQAGLNAIRISLNSCDPDLYNLYYQPKNYGFGDIVKTIQSARDNGMFVCLNYLVFPGVNDSEQECEHFFDLLDHGWVDMIQWRNLSGDPYWFLDKITDHIRSSAKGLKWLIEETRQRYPLLEHGYFNVNTEAEVNSMTKPVKTARPSCFE